MHSTAAPVPARHSPRTSRHRWLLVGSTVLAVPVLVLVGWLAVGGITWLRYGRPSLAVAADSLTARLLPRPEVAEHHERLVTASPSAVWASIPEFELQQSPIVRAIVRTRQLMLSGTSQPLAHTPFLKEVEALGWERVTTDAPRAIAYAAVTQPWNAEVVFHGLPAQRFARFDSVGHVKIAWSIGVDSLGPNLSRVWSDTRVATTDISARRRFRRYWAVFSPGIIIIRYEALRVIATSAERAPPDADDRPR